MINQKSSFGELGDTLSTYINGKRSRATAMIASEGLCHETFMNAYILEIWCRPDKSGTFFNEGGRVL